jgi:cytochrome c biogenesis protein CcmG, thiol:disulfide interchange protein DsbE
MGFRITKTVAISVLLVAICAAAVVYAFASGEDSVAPGAGNPESAASDYQAALADAPKPLADLYARGDALLEGGAAAFEARLAELRGYPVVVNKWASWCGPCRFEFPFFQSQAAARGAEVAFIGVDSDDSPDAARTFLEELPLPYPSFSDPGQEIARLFNAREFPSTAFYDADGELVYVRRGGYASEDELAADLDRYAGPDG